MRLILFIILSLCFKNSNCQAVVKGPGSASEQFASVFTKSQEVLDSAKQEILYRELESIARKYPTDEFCFNLIGMGLNLTYRQIETLVKLIDSSVYQSPSKAWTDVALKRIDAAETGKPFPSLILTDSSGVTLQIHDLKGKVVLIDVWSSWCGPCREQIPEIRKLYKKYNSKGFEIIGISLDDNRNKWLNAIIKDKQTWKEYCELVLWPNNKFASRFSIKSIPANYLIDDNGILVGQNLSPESIGTWLRQHL